jgi:hypothetical protein
MIVRCLPERHVLLTVFVPTAKTSAASRFIPMMLNKRERNRLYRVIAEEKFEPTEFDLHDEGDKEGNP